MSSILAGGVAGAPLSTRTAQAPRSQASAQAQRFSAELRGVVETDKADLQTKDTDEEMPDRQAPGYDDLWKKRQQQANAQTDARSMPELPIDDPAASLTDATLYHHIDIRA